MTTPSTGERGAPALITASGDGATPSSLPLPRSARDQPSHPISRRRWWREVVLIGAFYTAYTAIRDARGTRPVSVAVAYRHARSIIAFERYLGVFHEAQIQHWFLMHRTTVEVLDVWYGATQFLVTAAVLVALYFCRPAAYRRWRNTLAVATALALAGFALFPLLPPRLLPARYGFVDTLRVVGGLWAFNSGPMPHITNQYAAMPSLHCAWAVWCALAATPLLVHRWSKALTVLYPAITVLCVIVTANHYFTDAAAGALIVVAGYGCTRAVEALNHRVRQSEVIR